MNVLQLHINGSIHLCSFQHLELQRFFTVLCFLSERYFLKSKGELDMGRESVYTAKFSNTCHHISSRIFENIPQN